MKVITRVGTVIILGLALPLLARAEWQSDYDKALATAKAEGKATFINFTGSDWCGPCIEMQKRVFSQKEFLDYAAKHLILVEIDYPRIKPLSEKTKKQNERLKIQFKIDKVGFPTIALVDAAGTLLGTSTGYNDEGPSEIIARIEKWAKH
ncbi:MAG: thioredoxin family protein [Spartobacteria bacterium]